MIKTTNDCTITELTCGQPKVSLKQTSMLKFDLLPSGQDVSVGNWGEIGRWSPLLMGFNLTVCRFLVKVSSFVLAINIRIICTILVYVLYILRKRKRKSDVCRLP